MTSVQLLAAYLLDLFIGDPRWLPHPVVIIGKAIIRGEKILLRSGNSTVNKKISGAFLVFVIVLGSYSITWGILYLAAMLNEYLAFFLSIWLTGAALAGTSLAKAAQDVIIPLESGNIEEARHQVGMIVGRDTGNLDEANISRAVIETVAENTSDGFIAPLFFAVIGGAPLAIAYKAVNTLDSMIGYKSDKYIDFGWAAARFDDLANYIPARLTGLFFLVVGILTRLNVSSAISAIRNDAPKHPSPNAGIPEAAVAGLLGIQLGGINYYKGVKSERCRIGTPNRTITMNSIRETVKLMRQTVFLFTMSSAVIAAFLWGFY